MPTLSRFYGRNGSDAPTEINDAEATVLQNFVLSDHSMEVRKGYTIELTDSAAPANPVWGLHRSYIVDGAPFWMYSLGNLVRSTRTGSQATIFTTTTANRGIHFVEANGSIYILTADTTDGVRKSDGTAGGTVAHPDADCPKASLGLWHNKRLFLNDLNNLSRIWFSSTNTPDTFINQESSAIETDGGWMSISLGDGDRIKAFGRLGSALFIFKERSIHMLIGSSFVGDEKFRLIELYRGIGCKSPRSVVPVENGLMFLDSDGFYRYFYGPSRRLVSAIGRPMEDLTKAIPAARLEEASGGYFDRRYISSFAGSGQSINTETWMCDFRIIAPFLEADKENEMPSGWSEVTGLETNQVVVTNGQSDTPLPYLADANSTGKVFKFLSGTDDNGAAIAWAWRSKAYGVDAPTQVKAVTEVTSATRTQTGAITHEIYGDLATSATASRAITPSAGLAINTWKPGEAAVGKVVQVGLSASSLVGGEVLGMSWDWAAPRKEKVDG